MLYKPPSSSIPDSEILHWLRNGYILVNLHTLEVHKMHRRRKRWKLLSVQYHPLSGRARFVVSSGFRKRTIFRNRLIWMAKHLQTIPPSHVIDHIDGNRLNDSPDNLRLQSSTESHQQGYCCYMDEQYHSWTCLLDYIAFYGHAPPVGHPYWD